MARGPTTAAHLLSATAFSIATLLCVGGVEAQTLRPTVQSDGPLPPMRVREPSRPQQLQADPPSDAETAPPVVPGGVSSRTRTPPREPARLPAPIRGTVAESEQLAAATAIAPAAMLETIDDGDTPGSRRDAEEDPSADLRSAHTAAVAEFDAELFQAEVEPILDRRPARLYRFEPWQQRGIRVGSFVALPEVEIGGAWLSNVLRSTPARSDAAAYLRPSLRLRSEWRTHALEIGASGFGSWFGDLSSEDDLAYRLEARGRIDVTRRTNVELLGSHETTQEARGRIDSGGGARGRSDIASDRAAAAFNTRFNRLTVQLRGAIATQDYADAPGVADDRSRDLTVHEQAVRVGWQFKPTLTAFAEIATDQRKRAAASPSDGIRRDSDGERYRTGLSFGNRGNVVRGEIAVGWGRQTPDDARLGTIEGTIVDANLAWRVDGLNAVLLQARSDISETTLSGSSGALARSAGIEWRHAFLRPLIGSVGIAYATRDYQGVAVSERDLTTAVGIEYYLGPEAMVFGRWEHIAYDSTVPGGDWTGDEIRIGLRVRR